MGVQLKAPVVVGVDGTQQGLHAVQFAVAEARRVGCGVRLVHSLPELAATSPIVPMVGYEAFDDVAQKIIREAEQTARTHWDGLVPLEKVIRTGPRVHVLVQESVGARHGGPRPPGPAVARQGLHGLHDHGRRHACPLSRRVHPDGLAGGCGPPAGRGRDRGPRARLPGPLPRLRGGEHAAGAAAGPAHLEAAAAVRRPRRQQPGGRDVDRGPGRSPAGRAARPPDGLPRGGGRASTSATRTPRPRCWARPRARTCSSSVGVVTVLRSGCPWDPPPGR